MASDQLFLAVKLQQIMSNTTFFHVYTSADPIGVQLGGALKNPLAVGAGMITGMGFALVPIRSQHVSLEPVESCVTCVLQWAKIQRRLMLFPELVT